MTINYEYFRDGRLPHYMEDGTRRWIEHGSPVGHFLSAVIEHDLFEALGRADLDNRAALFEWVRFFTNEAPRRSHGRGALKGWPERLSEYQAAVEG